MTCRRMRVINSRLSSVAIRQEREHRRKLNRLLDSYTAKKLHSSQDSMAVMICIRMRRRRLRMS